MQTPDPLPQPGAWLVTADGSMYEIRHCAGEHGPCTVPPADADGVFYWSVNEGERIWTPWSDVEAVGTYDEVDAIAADAVRAQSLAEWTPPAPAHETGPRIVGQLGAYAIGAPAPETVARYVVTIRHRQGGDPYTPAMLRAVADVMASALAAAGIPATATAERFPHDLAALMGEA